MRKKITLLLVFALLLTSLSGCAAKEAEVPYTEKTKEEIFAKTVHDFEGLQVENLDDQENTNFLVYAEKVKVITVGSDANTLVGTDYEKRTYTFENADAVVKGLERGDVLYAKATQENPEMVAAKVKRIEEDGDQVTVYSDEISLGDLFVYADVCMEVPVEELQPEQTATAGEKLTAQTLTGVPDGTVQLTKLAKKTLVVNKTLSHTLNIQKGMSKDGKTKLGVTGYLSATLKSATLEFRFSQEHMQLYCGVWCDLQTAHKLKVAASGELINYSAPLPKIPLTIAGFPILIEPTAILKVSGKVTGELDFGDASRKGFTAAVSPTEIRTEPVDKVLSPAGVTGGLTELEGTLSAGVEWKPTTRFGFIGNIYGSVYGGLDVTAALRHQKKKTEDAQEHPDSIHNCHICIDGDVSLAGKISCGLKVKFDFRRSKGKISDELKNLLKDNRKELEKYQAETTLWQDNWKFADFYLSIPDVQTDDADFGWGECPNIRYRTTVTVRTEEGNPAPEAVVKADCYEAPEEEVTADEDGIAIIYLPNGENTLTARHAGQSGTVNTNIENASADVSMTLKRREIYFDIKYVGVYYNGEQPSEHFDSTAFPEFETFLRSRYPDAHFAEGHKFLAIDEGDIVVFFTVQRIMNQEYQSGLYAATPFSMLDMTIYMDRGAAREQVFYGEWDIRYGWNLYHNPSLPYEITKINVHRTGWMRTYEEPYYPNYTYVLDFINDTTGVHSKILGFAEEACQYIDATLEGGGQEVTQ